MPRLLRLPKVMDVEWPLPRRLSPFYPAVAEESASWLAAFHVFTPDKQETFDRGNYGKRYFRPQTSTVPSCSRGSSRVIYRSHVSDLWKGCVASTEPSLTPSHSACHYRGLRPQGTICTADPHSHVPVPCNIGLLCLHLVCYWWRRRFCDCSSWKLHSCVHWAVVCALC